MQTFVGALAAAVTTGGAAGDDAGAPVFVGATGGVRDAIHEKRVSPGDLLAFESALKAKVGNAATFAVLTGDDEARYVPYSSTVRGRGTTFHTAAHCCTPNACARPPAGPAGGGASVSLRVDGLANAIYADRIYGRKTLASKRVPSEQPHVC